MLPIRLLVNSKVLLLGLLVCLLVPGYISHARAANAPDQLKAAYLYNFAKLIYWPDTAFSNKSSPFVMCAFARDQLTEQLIKIRNKSVGGRTVQIVALGINSSPEFCHMVFVDKSHSEAWFKYNLKQYQGQLLVGETDGFINRGGVISFYLENDKLRFRVSTHNAKISGVKISSRLLRLAKIVEAD